ncbi:hypothetical protein G6F50_017980 [Rhizopus delemar]|uniref:Ppx/GppA phosphatase N-terminal domain-containing protein n=1 Tax=Rhizopus delemar TaxID=936053 RepID=A0A9P6XP40_9FUNG|nr:hypothetical protein G6F50_017980 [Rhizopus delemar]
MSSLYMGCVSYSRQVFSDGVVDAHQMKQAELAARREIEVIAKQYRKMGWKEAYGSSGTAKALPHRAFWPGHPVRTAGHQDRALRRAAWRAGHHERTVR